MSNLFKYFISVFVLFSHLEINAQQCEAYLERGVNPSNGNVYLYSSSEENIFFVKIISAKSTNYYMSVQNSGHSVTSTLLGLTLTLEDGSNIDKPNNPVRIQRDIEHTFGRNRFQFSSYFLLTADEINKITSVGIAQYKLYKYKYSLSKSDRKAIKEKVSCLLLID